MRVKICGITRAADAHFARQSGAWALGFIMTPVSKRCITDKDAADIIATLPADTRTAGVFVNQMQDCARMAALANLRMIQLHGDETPEDCANLRAATGLEIIKALRLKTRDDLGLVAAYQNAADYLLLDAAADGYGGTGTLADQNLAAAACRQSRLPVLLAGGLNPDNITAARQAVNPWGFDLSSGVEDAPGIKNHEKIKNLFLKEHA